MGGEAYEPSRRKKKGVKRRFFTVEGEVLGAAGGWFMEMRLEPAFLGSIILLGWVLAAFLFFFGSIFGRRLLGLMFIFTLLIPFLPSWGVVVFAVIVGLVVLQGFAALIFGKGAADAMIGSLAAELVRFVFIAFVLPFRLVRHFLQRR